ncbi:hypothetical protein [Citreimonas sp.]|uniref:hypothetical protein n=1 Tax=Citreimonas sp. TaxID=3036715 RepID=UPI0035C821D0
MDLAFFLPLLAMITLLAVVIFALFSKKKTEDRRHDPSAPKSHLAADAPSSDSR